MEELITPISATIKAKSIKTKGASVSGRVVGFDKFKDSSNTNKVTGETFSKRTFRVSVEGHPQPEYVEINSELLPNLLNVLKSNDEITIQPTASAEQETIPDGRTIPTGRVFTNWHFVLPLAELPTDEAERLAAFDALCAD
jgi:hypothetical protein